MSDPKATPMTLEEAVEIERIGPPSTPRWSDFDENPASGPIYERDMSTFNRARAIVDQAVKAHKALTQYADLPSTAAIHDQFGAKNKWMEAVDKLRALERGEEVQP